MKTFSWECKPYAVLTVLTAVFMLAAAPVCAQWQPVVKNTAKAAAKKTPAATRVISQTSAQKAAPAATKKAMSDANKRLYYSLMTKAGVAQKKALRILYKHGAQPTRYAMPKLSETSLLFQKFPTFTAQENLPSYPFNNPYRVFYRGISIDEDGLRNILQNGLRSQDSGTHHNDFAVFTYQSKALVDMANQAIGENKNICLISKAKQAESYALRRSKIDGKTPLVIQVKNTIPHQRNPMGMGVLSAGDIPLNQIVRISALLPVDGTLVWGDISLTPTGDFLFTPYETR